MSTTPPPSPPEPQPPFGAGGYPSFPAESAAAASRPTPPQPPSIRRAVRLMWVGAVVTGVGMLVSLTMLGSLKDEARDAVLESDPDATQAMIDAAYAFMVVAVIVGPLIAIGLWAWMAWKNGQGRSWARVVATTLGVINVLFTLIALTAAATAGSAVVINLISLALAGTILVMLWRRESSDYYAAVSDSRIPR